MGGENIEYMTINKDFEEICLERERYLLNIDNLLIQTLEDRYNIIDTIQISENVSREIGQENDAEAALA